MALNSLSFLSLSNEKKMESSMQLGRYLLTSRIASGGMADIYRSKLIGVEGFEKEFAIKKILPHWSHNQDFINMLIDEAKVLVRLNHPNIVQVFELNKHNEIYFIVMEYIRGVDLRRMIKQIKEKNFSIEGMKDDGEKDSPAHPREAALSAGLAAFIARKICQGLSYAHEKKDKFSKGTVSQPLGIVHRDISPQNILLSFDGEVKITDFGIAKARGRTAETVAGTLKGKFSYMSPEQALGAEVDLRTDIFAVGILLYEMVTGERCFKGKSDMETLEVVRQALFQWPPASSVPIPEELKSVISRALNKRCEERYQTASEMGKDLAAIESRLGPGFSEQDLKLVLARLFADEIAKDQEWENELSQKTRVRTSLNKTNVVRRLTKIFFGATRVHEDSQTVQTLVGRSLKILLPAQNKGPENRNISEASEPIPPKRQLSIKSLRFQSKGVILLFIGVLLLGIWRFHPLFKREMDSKTQKTVTLEKTVGPVLNDRLVAPTLSDKEKGVPHDDSLIPPLDIGTSFSGESSSGTPSPEMPSNETTSPETTSPLTTSSGMESSGVHREAQPEGKIEPNKEAQSLEKKEESQALEKTAPKKEVYGRLQVSAEPWGRVSIGGVVSGADTLYTNRRIPVGSYNLKVFFPPLKKTVSTKVSIRQGAETNCRASFSKKSYVSCR